MRAALTLYRAQQAVTALKNPHLRYGLAYTVGEVLTLYLEQFV